ncbi:MAG TPA: SAM-dependent methyltransferase [Planctomycetaceae bacterium]|nr:SAM-dependent methyltransferase [Planctomycetaceae bacterium]
MSVDFTEVADYYDAMYVDQAGYEKECKQVAELVRQYGKTDGNALLDIACGTGEQARYLSRQFQVVGFDLSRRMIEIAQKKVADKEFQAEFHVADMCDFELGGPFDVAVNLYGSIGFAENAGRMQAAVRTVHRHLKNGGVFILTPWSTRETFQEGIFSAADQRDGVCFCRMEVIRRFSDDKVRVEMHHLIGKDMNVRSYKHEQTITLFSETEYVSALESAGFEIVERLGVDQFRMGAFVCLKTEPASVYTGNAVKSIVG